MYKERERKSDRKAQKSEKKNTCFYLTERYIDINSTEND